MMTRTEYLYEYFPEVDLPVLVSEENLSLYSTLNKPLPKKLIDEFILKWEESYIVDSFTEFIPCFRIPAQSDQYIGIVYWKASLMRYEYIFVTISKKDFSLISRKCISGSVAEGSIIKKSVAQIDTDFLIHILAGATEADIAYDSNASQGFYMQIEKSGHISFYQDEENLPT